MKDIDLHMHSNASLDGDYSVSELISQCAHAGLRIVALADHNSVENVADFMTQGKEHDITVIPAIEIDCHYFGVNLHILGYNIDINNPAFNQLGRDLLIQEQMGSQRRVELIEAMGIYVNHDKLKTLIHQGVITGEMIAEAALHEPENEGNVLLEPFLPGGAQDNNPYVNFYWEYCAQGKQAYVPITIPTLQEIIPLIKEKGGVAVFAHPGHNIHEDPQLLDAIMKCGLDGIEVYSSYHNSDQIAFYEDYAKDTHKLITCGSDYHGKIKPSIELGAIDLPLNYHKKIIDTLL